MNIELMKQFAILSKSQVLDKQTWISIRDAHVEREEFIREYKAFTSEKLPIDDRKMPDENKVNNKLKNAFRTKIVNQVVGYLFGSPIKYEINGTSYSSKELLSTHALELERFGIRNTIDDLDAETGKLQAINGKCYRLVYTDIDGFDMVKKLKASDIIYFDDEHAIWYYNTINEDGQEIQVIEYYQKTTYSIYKLNLETNVWTVDKENQLHNYDYMPIVEFLNNDEGLNDFYIVESLIDAYDKLISDTSSEFEQFRLAYMVFLNCSVDDETFQKMKQTGALSLDSNSGEKADAKFIVKDVDVAFVEWLEKKLKENIYDFSASIDMSDEKFSGQSQSGESRKYKMIALENKATLKERKFRKGLRRMFKVLCSKWNKSGVGIDYLDIRFTFNRKLPVDLSYAGDVLNKLSPYLSQQTLLGQLDFVDNPKEEIERKRQEEEENNQVFNNFNNQNQDE